VNSKFDHLLLAQEERQAFEENETTGTFPSLSANPDFEELKDALFVDCLLYYSEEIDAFPSSFLNIATQ
jgi:hypothetical protein